MGNNVWLDWHLFEIKKMLIMSLNVCHTCVCELLHSYMLLQLHIKSHNPILHRS